MLITEYEVIFCLHNKSWYIEILGTLKSMAIN